ncbi:hypothetical protein EON83_22575 [bacterium]|nr:MAG: hypothetical protein EON83_22575 [bacterium]
MITTLCPTATSFSPSRHAPQNKAEGYLRHESKLRQLLPFPEEEWARLHLALGVNATRVGHWLANASPTLRHRYQLALVQQANSVAIGDYLLLHDPVEDEPQWRTAFEEAEEMLAFELELAGIGDGPNFCFFLWNEKARFLKEEFGLEWFSPAQMNPFVRFA